MWSRVAETMLACWLAASPFVFGHADDAVFLWATDFGAAALIATFALASLSRRWEKLHLAELAVVGWLVVGAVVVPETSPPPAAHQNHVVVGLLVAMLAVLPTRAMEPPRAWIEFYQRRGLDVDPYGLEDL